MKKSVLRAYARLIARTGVNIQKGQEVFIAADLDQPEFVAMLVDECYKCKAKKVVVDWNYQPLQKLHVRHRSLTTLSRVEDYELARWQHYVDTIPCRIYLLSEDPDGLKGIDQEKLAKSQQAKFPVIKPYRDQIENRYQWCIAAVPGEAWAKKLFPGLRKSQAVEKLWEAILSTSRALEGDPQANWAAHNKDIHDRRDYLNSLHIRQLKYRSANGTDLTVGIADKAIWESAGSKNEKGVFFLPNIPTEEVFTAPHKEKVNGIVYGTKPYVFNGQLIKGFHVTFKDGKVVEHGAEEGADLLGRLLDTDEGARHIGEVALVPASSPINRCGKLFYNTLFDENAACHIAFGDSYPGTTVGGTGLTREQLDARGMNHSSLHEDVMIGAEDSEITGKCRDGRTVQLFQNGVWVL